MNLQRTTPIDEFRRIPQLDAEDAIIGNVTLGTLSNLLGALSGAPGQSSTSPISR
ncbi:MAG: hypothetical protein HYZ58_19210 [Acidobacteria bacterium]|nr:hypothetical protein [Acidobacteriota bacterium]